MLIGEKFVTFVNSRSPSTIRTTKLKISICDRNNTFPVAGSK